MDRTVTYKPATPNAISKGWGKIKIVHVASRGIEYKEFYYISDTLNPFSGQYFEHLYKTVWIKFERNKT